MNSVCGELFASPGGRGKVACVIVGKEPDSAGDGKPIEGTTEVDRPVESESPQLPSMQTFYVPVDLLTSDSPVFTAMFESM